MPNQRIKKNIPNKPVVRKIVLSIKIIVFSDLIINVVKIIIIEIIHIILFGLAIFLFGGILLPLKSVTILPAN
ncbi:unnamed protein product [marine sediment metagenome]|uniref:Uncharacterized protein n=1 Tax=marine sediment metagenome TaxID=412755 RepID=X1G588_9ZZZZ